MALGTFTLTGSWKLANGANASGRIRIEPTYAVVDGVTNNVIVPKAPFEIELTAGAISQAGILVISEVDEGYTYTVTELIDKQDSREYVIAVPDDAAGSTLAIADLVTTTPPAAPSTISMAQIEAALSGSYVAQESLTVSGFADIALALGLPLDPRWYGAEADGTTDDTAAWEACYTALPIGGTMIVPPGESVVGAFEIRKAMTLQGGGAFSRVLPPASGSGWCIEVLGAAGAETLENDCVYGVKLENFGLEGRARAVDFGGIRLRDVQRSTIEGVHVANFQRAAMFWQRRVRNNRFVDVVMKGCADLDGTYPAHITIDSTDTADGTNNNYLIGVESVNPFGDHVLARKSNTSSSIRNNFFVDCMFHGVDVGDGAFESYGETLTADYRCTSRVVVQNARNTVLTNCRFNVTGPGQPFILSREYPSVTTVNGLVVQGASFGAVDTLAATFTASGDVLTSAGHGLATGALVRVSTSGTLPSGLSAATDYWVIRADADTFELATSRADAEAGTQVTLSSAGSGTHTVTAQEMQVLTEYGSVRVGPSIFEGTMNRKPVVVIGSSASARVDTTTGQAADLIEDPNTAAATPGFSIRKIKTADETVNTSATLQDDNHLSFAVAANETWTFEALLYVTGNTTADLRVAATWPSGATGILAVHGSRASDALVSAFDATSTSGGAVGQIGVDTGPRLVRVVGTVEVSSTAGTVQLQWAQQTSTGADTTVKRGSSLVATRIA